MRRTPMLLAVALMMVLMMALSGAALAQPVAGNADAKCLELARQTLGFDPNFNPANTNFIGGTEGRDAIYDNVGPLYGDQGTEGRDVICGFGGNDYIYEIDEGDIFIGGEGNDRVDFNRGTVYGDAGDDTVGVNFVTFYGGEGNDYVYYNLGTFYGGGGIDEVRYPKFGTVDDYGTVDGVEIIGVS